MAHEQRENIAFIIFKSIIVFISLCIAGFLIALFCMVSKVEAMSLIPLINFEGYTNNSFSGTPTCTQPNQCSGIRSFTARFQSSGTPLVVQNETYSIEFVIQAMPSYNPVPSSIVKPRIYFLVNNNWVQGSPDRYENKRIVNNCNESNLVCYYWSFELDSTIYTDITQVNVSFDYGWIEYFSSNNPVQFWIENLSLQNDTERILNGIDKQTSILQENIDGNTTRITNELTTINDTLNNDSVSSDRGNTIVNGISSNAGNGLSGIINTPLGVISGLLQQNTCSDIVAPLPFVNRNLTLPCLTPIYEDKFGSFFDIYQVIITGIVAYWVTMNIFLKTKKMSMPDDDRIEVLDL